MLVQINSSNASIGYILNKNPSSGLLIKSLRKGFVLGKFINPLTYVCAFEEGPNQDSFEKEGNYLVYRGYCSAEAALSILTTLFDCISKDKNKQYEDGPSLNTIYIPCIDVSNVSMFNTDDYKVTSYVVADNCNLADLTLTNNGSLIDLIRYTALILFMQVLRDNVTYLQWDRLVVYANIIKKDDKVPFVVRHRLRGILEPSLVKKAVPLLNNDSIKLSNHGRNEQQRMAFVSNYIINRSCVLDIGCGPAKYIKVVKPTKYIGVDIDENVLEKAKVKGTYFDNVDTAFYNNYKEALDSLTEDTTVLLIEVLEHMPKHEAMHLLMECILNKHVSQILVSTPNKDFNKFFGLGPNDVRYYDHLFEFTQDEFTNVFSEALFSSVISWGDSVDSISMTLYANVVFNSK